MAFGDVARDGRLHGGVAERHLGLREVGLADHHVGRGALVGGHRIVQVELAGGILLVEGADAVQVALGLGLQRAGLVELGGRLVGAGAVEAGVDDEERLPFLDVGTLGEEHLFEVALDAGADFDELLGADAAHVFAVDVDILGRDGLDLHHGQHHDFGARPQPEPEQAARHQQQEHAARNLLPAAQMYLHAGNPGKRPLYEIGGPAYDARLDSFENPFEIHNK